MVLLIDNENFMEILITGVIYCGDYWCYVLVVMMIIMIIRYATPPEREDVTS